ISHALAQDDQPIAVSDYRAIIKTEMIPANRLTHDASGRPRQKRVSFGIGSFNRLYVSDYLDVRIQAFDCRRHESDHGMIAVHPAGEMKIDDVRPQVLDEIENCPQLPPGPSGKWCMHSEAAALIVVTVQPRCRRLKISRSRQNVHFVIALGQ